MNGIRNFSEENPEKDASIKLALDIGEWDDEVAVIVTDKNALLGCTSAWTGWYKHPRGGVYKICKDRDGYLVHKPGGGTDAWGKGYTWREVKRAYGLQGVRAYQHRCGGSC